MARRPKVSKREEWQINRFLWEQGLTPANINLETSDVYEDNGHQNMKSGMTSSPQDARVPSTSGPEAQALPRQPRTLRSPPPDLSLVDVSF